MKTKLFLATLLSFAFGLTLAACDEDDDGGGGGTICDQAGEALLDTCPELFEDDDGGDGGDGEPAECEGDLETGSQCILDNTQGACDAFAGDATTDEAMAYLECVTP